MLDNRKSLNKFKEYKIVSSAFSLVWSNKTEVNSRWELENLQISGNKIFNHLSITGFDKEKNDMGKIAMNKWKK